MMAQIRSCQEVLGGIGTWIWSVVYRWINLAGGAAIGTAQLWCSASKKEAPVTAYWWTIGICLVIASFQAWQEQYQKVKGKKRFELATDILDEHRRFKPPGEKSYDLIGLLILRCQEFGSERNLIKVCKILNKQVFDPFERLEMKYGKRAFRRKRLTFLREMRLSGYDASDDGCDHFIYSYWSERYKIDQPDHYSNSSRIAAIMKVWRK